MIYDGKQQLFTHAVSGIVMVGAKLYHSAREHGGRDASEEPRGGQDIILVAHGKVRDGCYVKVPHHDRHRRYDRRSECHPQRWSHGAACH
jgi:hypothetical protein